MRPKKAITPHASAALLAGMIAAAGALAHLPVPPPRRLAGYTPTLLAHFLARGASLNALPVVSVRLRTEAGERLRVAAKLRGSGDALFELASHYGTKAYEDCDTWYVTRLIARSVGGAPDADAWMLSNEAEEAALCRTRIAPLTAEAARAAEAAEAATPLRMTPPLDLKPLATGAYLTRDMSGEACAFLGKPKSDAGHEAILWLPLAAEERIVNLLALAKALAEDAPAAAARSAVTEAVMVVLDVSASMPGVAFHPPPPAADAGNSRVVFLTGFGSVLAQCTAQGGPPAAIEARLTARLTALCDALTGISPVRVGPHRHPETGAPRASAHLNFASPAAAEVAVLGLDGAPTGGGRSERLRAELAHGREADGGRRSGPRSGAAAAEGRDRLSLMKAALAAFAEHSIALDLPHAGGLLLCGSTVSPACALTPSLSLFWERSARAVAAVGGDARGGATRLYDALSRAAADLKTFAQQHPGCACRVLVLSDGEDTSRDSPSPALAALADARVTLDAVLLGSRAGVVAAMAEHTGGITVRADSEAAMLSAFQREAFLSLRARAADARYATRGPADEASLKRLAMELNRRADAAALRGAGLGLRRIGGDAPEDDAAAANVRPGGLALALHGDALAPQRLTAALAARVHAAAEDAPTRAARAPSGGRREARLVEELRRIQRTGFHADVDVFVSDDDIATWHLVLHAPPGKGLLYDGGAWRLLIDFPAGYPSAPPIVYFVTPILHVNVSRDGRCCHALLDRDYSSDAPLNQMLPALLAGLLAQPEPGDPLNCELAELYYADACANVGATRGEPVCARYELAVKRAVALHAAAPPEQLRAALRDAGAAQRVPAAPPSTPPARGDAASGRGRRRR
jgi:ubiquitin-protein ligase